MTDLAALQAAALKWANEMRSPAEPLDELPKGVRGDCDRCPLAVATGMGIDGSHYEATLGEVDALPEQVVNFTTAFDQGLFPELEISNADQ